MPEATVHEDHCLVPREYDVWFFWNSTWVNPVAEPEREECLAQGHLRPRVLTGVGALIQRGGRAVAGMLTIATAGGS